MLPRERLPFSPITDRPPLALPGGARLVLWPVLALEEWDIARPMARTVIPPPQGPPLIPDVANWSWHEYGMRVGFWRLHRMFTRLGISPTVTINAKVCESYPQVVTACLDSGWELTAHGYEHIPMHRLDNQPEVDRARDRRHHEVRRLPATGLVGSGPGPHARHARLPGRGRHRVHRRLGARR